MTRRLALFQFLLCVLLALGPGRASRASNLPAPPPDSSGTGWTATRLDLGVTIEPGAKRLRLDGTIHLRLDIAASFGPTLGINSTHELMRFTDAAGPPGAKLTLGKDVAGWPATRTACLRFDEAMKRGAEVDVTFHCESTGEDGFQFKVAPEAALSSWTSGWYPCALPTAEQGFSQDLLRVPGTTRFRLPAGWHSVSNGTRAERHDAGRNAEEVWQVDRPVARSFAAGPYSLSTSRAGDRSLSIYLLSPKPFSGDRQAQLLAKALAAQEAKLGPYPYASYAIVEVPEKLVKWYASSEQGFIMARSSAFEAEHGNLPLWAHEMAHGWWGNLVSTTGPGSIWVSESLAQYSAVIAIEAIEGAEAAAEFLEYSRSGYNLLQCALGYINFSRAGNDMPISTMSGEHDWEHNLSDAKGHWIYHMLRLRVGDDVFFATLRDIVRDFAHDALSVASLRQRFEAAAPDEHLDTFFSQWLDRRGAPVLAVRWWSIEDGQAASITVTQQQGEPFELPLEIAIDLKGGRTRLATLDVTKSEETFRVPTLARPLAVRIDPDRHALIWRPEYGPPPDPGR